MANGADLPGNAAADDSHGDVESISCSSQMKRLEQRSLIDCAPAEIIGRRAAIDRDLSGSRIESLTRATAAFLRPTAQMYGTSAMVVIPLLQVGNRVLVD